MATTIAWGRGFVAALVSALLLLSVVGCTAKETTTEAQQEQARQLAQELINDLEFDILPLRENWDRLPDVDVVVSHPDATLGAAQLYRFYEAYQRGEQAQVTIAFPTATSFAVARVVFDGQSGYYFRHQYDKEETGGLAVRTQFLDKVEWTVKPDQSKAELKLIHKKKDLATFSFRNLPRVEQD